VQPGEIKPEDVHVPGIYVQRILKGTYQKRIEVCFLNSTSEQSAD